MYSARALATLGVIGLLTAGCLPHPGAPVAERLRAANLPYIDEIKYQPLQPISDATGDWIEIFLLADVTDAEVVDMYCNIVTPAAASELGREGLIIYKGVTWHPPKSQPPASGIYRYWDGGTRVAEPTCPG